MNEEKATSLREGKCKFSKFLKKIGEKILELNLYSSPFLFSYKKKKHFQSKYGTIFSCFIIIVVIILVIDNTVYYNEKNTCPLKNTSEDMITTFDFDFIKNFFIFFSILHKPSQTYLTNEKINQYFMVVLEFQSLTYDPSLRTFTSNRKQNKFDECLEKPNFDAEDDNFQNIFPFTIFCPQDKQFSLEMKGNEISTLSLKLFLLKDIDLTQYFFVVGNMQYFFDTKAQKINIGYNVQRVKLKKDTVRIYRTQIIKQQLTSYDILPKSRTLYSYEFDRDGLIDKETNDNVLLLIEFDLPKTYEEITIQDFSFMFVGGIISGWILFFVLIGNFVVSRFIKFDKYLSIMKRGINLIDPKNREEMKMSKQNLLSRFQIEKNRQVEILTDLLQNNHNYSKLKFSFWETFQYFFICNCFKSIRQKKKEKIYLLGLKYLFQSMDITNFGRAMEEMKLAKEIIFEPYQKVLFEYLTTPILFNNKVISSFEIENDSVISNEELRTQSKKNINDVISALQNEDFYDDKDLQLIKLLEIEEAQKSSFFDVEKKLEISIKKFYDLVNYSQNEVENEKIIGEYQKYFTSIYSQLLNQISINEAIISQMRQLEKAYKYYYEENRIHKLFITKELQKAALKKKFSILDIVMKVITFFLNVIDSIFFIKNKLLIIKNNYNLSTFVAFQTIQHCIRILFLFSLYNLYFFIRSFIHNKISDKCTSWILCIGFLSYNLKPKDLFFNYTVSSIVFISILTIYSMCLVIIFFLSRGNTNEKSNTKILAQFVFTSPSFKIRTKEQQKAHINELSNKIPELYEASSKIIHNSEMNTLSFIIICFNILLMIGHFFLIIGAIYLFKISKLSSYFLKISLFSFSVGFLINIIVMIHFYSFIFLKTLSEKTKFSLKFWFPFASKLISFTVIIASNFSFLFQRDSSGFLSKVYILYDEKHFICREDQSAENLFWFIVYETVTRKIITLIYSIITKKKLISYTSEISLLNTLSQFLLVVVTMIVFPLIGTIGILFFILDFYFEYIILRKFRSIYNYQSHIDIIGFYSSITFILIVVYYIILRILFQNQFVVFENYVPEIKDNEELYESYPPMCRHQKVEDDFQWQWTNYFNEGILNICLTLLNFGIIPLTFGIFSVLQFFRGQIIKAKDSMRTMTNEFSKISYEDEKNLEDYENLKCLIKESFLQNNRKQFFVKTKIN